MNSPGSQNQGSPSFLDLCKDCAHEDGCAKTDSAHWENMNADARTLFMQMMEQGDDEDWTPERMRALKEGGSPEMSTPPETNDPEPITQEPPQIENPIQPNPNSDNQMTETNTTEPTETGSATPLSREPIFRAEAYDRMREQEAGRDSDEEESGNEDDDKTEEEADGKIDLSFLDKKQPPKEDPEIKSLREKKADIPSEIDLDKFKIKHEITNHGENSGYLVRTKEGLDMAFKDGGKWQLLSDALRGNQDKTGKESAEESGIDADQRVGEKGYNNAERDIAALKAVWEELEANGRAIYIGRDDEGTPKTFTVYVLLEDGRVVSSMGTIQEREPSDARRSRSGTETEPIVGHEGGQPNKPEGSPVGPQNPNDTLTPRLIQNEGQAVTSNEKEEQQDTTQWTMVDRVLFGRTQEAQSIAAKVETAQQTPQEIKARALDTTEAARNFTYTRKVEARTGDEHAPQAQDTRRVTAETRQDVNYDYQRQETVRSSGTTPEKSSVATLKQSNQRSAAETGISLYIEPEVDEGITEAKAGLEGSPGFAVAVEIKAVESAFDIEIAQGTQEAVEIVSFAKERDIILEATANEKSQVITTEEETVIDVLASSLPNAKVDTTTFAELKEEINSSATVIEKTADKIQDKHLEAEQGVREGEEGYIVAPEYVRAESLHEVEQSDASFNVLREQSVRAPEAPQQRLERVNNPQGTETFLRLAELINQQVPLTTNRRFKEESIDITPQPQTPKERAQAALEILRAMREQNTGSTPQGNRPVSSNNDQGSNIIIPSMRAPSYIRRATASVRK